MIITIKNTKLLALALAATVSLSSCLKNTGYEDTITDGSPKPAVMIADAANTDFKAFALDLTPPTETLKLLDVYLGDGGPAKKDYTIKIVKNAGLISDYNSVNGTNFIEIPANAYTGTFDIPVKAGTNLGSLSITLDKTKMDLTKNYALGLQIADASGAVINPNANYIIVNVGLKNKWDGVYSVKGRMLRAGDAVLSGPHGPKEFNFATSGPTSIEMVEAHPWANGSGSTLPGGYQPRLTLNTTTNLVTINSANGLISGTTTYTHRYDATSKTFYYEFTWGAGPSARLATDTITYLRPR